MKLIAVCLLALLATAVVGDFVQDRMKWRKFQRTYNKKYASKSEKDMRFKIFQNNLRIVEEKNGNPDQSATFGVTRFSDLTEQEFRSMYLMAEYERTHNEKPVGVSHEENNAQNDGPPPTSYNWFDEGACTHVYNQEQCGSCWAFSTTEEIESQWYLSGHNLTSLSVQQIVSCDNRDGGCNGGNPPTAYEYVMNAGGLETWADYPYTSGGGNTGYCKFNKRDIVANIKSWDWVSRSDAKTPEGNETAMLYGSWQYGPLSICVDASSWQHYHGGIVTSDCGRRIDHCVQLTGWNTQNNVEYWIVRNSWGALWGESGFIYVQRNKDLCAIADEVTRATAA